jgi:hypothetical protein
MTRERIEIALELGCLRLPTEWHLETDKSGRRVAVPRLLKSKGFDEIDGWELRDRFFRMEESEKSALDFLNYAGVWIAEEIAPQEGRDVEALRGHFSSRLFEGRARCEVLTDLWGQRRWWYSLVTDKRRLAMEFARPAASEQDEIYHWRFAWMTRQLGTLPMHIEWRQRGSKSLPFSVVETATGFEALIATTHLDVIRGGQFRYCKRCRMPFIVLSKHKKKFCGWNCAHVVAERRRRRRLKANQEEN